MDHAAGLSSISSLQAWRVEWAGSGPFRPSIGHCSIPRLLARRITGRPGFLDPAVDDLLLDRAVEPLGDAVGLWLPRPRRDAGGHDALAVVARVGSQMAKFREGRSCPAPPILKPEPTATPTRVPGLVSWTQVFVMLQPLETLL